MMVISTRSKFYSDNFVGRAKPVPPPRSHSLEQTHADKKLTTTTTNSEGSDASPPAKNENLIAGKHRKMCQV